MSYVSWKETEDLHRGRFMSTQGYPLGSALLQGGTGFPNWQGQLKRSQKHANIDYKPVLRSRRPKAGQSIEPAMNYEQLQRIMQKYSPKRKFL
jgi:hypothetical protein